MPCLWFICAATPLWRYVSSLSGLFTLPAAQFTSAEASGGFPQLERSMELLLVSVPNDSSTFSRRFSTWSHVPELRIRLHVAGDPSWGWGQFVHRFVNLPINVR